MTAPDTTAQRVPPIPRPPADGRTTETPVAMLLADALALAAMATTGTTTPSERHP